MRPIVMLSDLLIPTFTVSLATSRLSQQANGMETDDSSCRVMKSYLMEKKYLWQIYEYNARLAMEYIY
jgi:hypothetical protein